MEIVFVAKSADAKPLRDVTIDRLRFALRRLVQQVSTARVSFTDVNGPRGGVDKHAQIQLHLQSRGTVVVGATASNWRAALENALRLIVAKIVKTFKQANRPKRQSMKALLLAHTDDSTQTQPNPNT
ncbi:MAG: HPF/RaiA family ribosome-associated protein [Burkholderiales bacterium]|nr:HPF/RaiA family ribosome-associated protein [Burkholderiales bacterium]